MQRMTVAHVEAQIGILNTMMGFVDHNGTGFPDQYSVGTIRLYRSGTGSAIKRVTKNGGMEYVSGFGTLRETSNFLSGMIAAFHMKSGK